MDLSRHSARPKIHPGGIEKLRIPSNPIALNVMSKYTNKDPEFSLDVGYNRWNLVKANVKDFVTPSRGLKHNSKQRINLSKPFTISFWILSNNSSPGPPLHFSSEQGSHFKVAYGMPRTFGEIRLEIGSQTVSTGLISEDAWHLITICNEPGTRTKLFFDGRLKGSMVSETPTDQDYLIWLLDFDGVLDDFKVFDSALSADQVERLVQNEIVSFISDTGQDENLPEPVCHLRFNKWKNTYIRMD